MTVPIEEQIRHQRECWYCAAAAYCAAIMHEYTLFLQIQTAYLTMFGQPFRSKAGTSAEALSEEFRQLEAAFEERAVQSLKRFAADPEEFLCVSAPDQAELKRTSAERKALGENPRQHQVVFPRTMKTELIAPSRAFCLLFASLIDGLQFVITARRPLDVTSSPILPEALVRAHFLTTQMQASEENDLREWHHSVSELLRQFQHLQRWKKHRRDHGASMLVSFELRAQLKQIVAQFSEQGHAQAKDVEPDPIPNCDASDDYRCVVWYGTQYEFSTNQAEVVGKLWKAFYSGRAAVSGETLVESNGSVRDVFKIKGSVFHPAWKTMIQKVPTTKNMYHLVPPR